ncbi:MAG: ribosome biogenesis GTPase Der [Arcobacteraceae bacterium]|jgi:GTP-binding protein|nr:ribosome biogenesis GTPase Der [Arcobacteraceae bacterium]
MIKIALIGQPNVGKSSLFNRIAKKRVAIVSDLAGTTRDIRRREVKILNREAMMLDTGGIDDTDDAIFSNVKRKAIETAKEADIVLFMVDGKRIPDEKDSELFYALQRLGKNLALVVNKIDNDKEKENLWEFYSFGIDEERMFPISVSHNRGTVRLFEWLHEQLPMSEEEIIANEIAQNKEADEDEDFSTPEREPRRKSKVIVEEKKEIDPNHIKIAIIGKPNVGKSSILNAIIGEERSVVSPIAGTTIDPVDETFIYNDKKITFVDTAGLRRRGKILGIEKYALMRTEDMLQQSNIALVVLDASVPIADQDEKVSGLVDKFGLGVIIVLNKWDENMDTYEKVTKEVRDRFRFLYYAPIMAVSAKTGRNIDKLKDKIITIFENYNKRISTSVLNATIKKAIQRHALPSPNGNRLRIYFATQFNTNPPTVALVMNKPSMLHFSYKRYLINILREYLDFEGVPIRIVARKKGERIDDDELNVVYQELMVPKELYIESDDGSEEDDFYDDEEYLDDEYEDGE